MSFIILLFYLFFQNYVVVEGTTVLWDNGGYNYNLTTFINQLRQDFGNSYALDLINSFNANHGKQQTLNFEFEEITLQTTYNESRGSCESNVVLDLAFAAAGSLPYVGSLFKVMSQLRSCAPCEYDKSQFSVKYGDYWSEQTPTGIFIKVHKVGMQPLKYPSAHGMWETVTDYQNNYKEAKGGIGCTGKASYGNDEMDNFQIMAFNKYPPTINAISACWGAGAGGAGNLALHIPNGVIRECAHQKGFGWALNDAQNGGIRLDTNDLIGTFRVRAYEYMWAASSSQDWNTMKNAVCHTMEFHDIGMKQDINKELVWFMLNNAGRYRMNCNWPSG